MRRYIIIICVIVVAVIAVIVARGCTSDDNNGSGNVLSDSTGTAVLRMSKADMVAAIRHESKLYTAEQTAHKDIVISTSEVFPLIGVKIPWSKSTMKIPIDVTYKACIDLGKVTDRNITVDERDSSITITLPSPVIELTSCEIRHDDEVVDRQIFSSPKSQEFINKHVGEAEKEIWTEVSLQNKKALFDSARMNANKIIADALLRSGYKTVMITYAPDFNVNDIKVDVGQTIEKLKD